MKKEFELTEYFEEKGIHGELMQTIKSMFRLREYKLGDMVLRIDDNRKVVCLILQGIVRGVYTDKEGQEITKCFSREGEWCCFYNMLDISLPEYCIEALEDCKIAEIEVEQLRGILENSQELRVLYNDLYNQAFMISDEKSITFQRMQAKERYEYFAEKYPDIEKRVKQEYIASYIGITPSSLSRIKRQL